MDAMDKRKIITIDISGAFLQGNWPQEEHPGYIMFEGIMVDIIYENDSTYHDKIIWSKDCGKNSCTVDSSKQYTIYYLAQSSSITSYLNTWLIIDLYRTNTICVYSIRW